MNSFKPIAGNLDMTGNSDPIDVEKALLDPTAVFRIPEEIPPRNDLTLEPTFPS